MSLIYHNYADLLVGGRGSSVPISSTNTERGSYLHLNSICKEAVQTVVFPVPFITTGFDQFEQFIGPGATDIGLETADGKSIFP